MGSRIKLPNTNFAKAGGDLGRLAKDVAKFIGNHKEKFLGGGLLLVAADGIWVRLGRKKDQKTFEESSVNQQKVAHKHEAEITALLAETEQAREVNRRIDQLDK